MREDTSLLYGALLESTFLSVRLGWFIRLESLYETKSDETKIWSGSYDFWMNRAGYSFSHKSLSKIQLCFCFSSSLPHLLSIRLLSFFTIFIFISRGRDE
jgi:hypothetical protein